MADPQIQLDYAQHPPPWHRRKKVRHRIAAGALLVLLWSAWNWGPSTWHGVRGAYWQRRCMKYTAPANQVVYEEDPVLARALLNSPDYAATVANPQFVARGSDPWRAFVPSGYGDGAAFMHERTTPSGKHRLVVVGIYLFRGFPERPRQLLFLGDCVVLPGVLPTTFVPAGHVAWNEQVTEFTSLLPTDRVRLYAGQPDPADGSHFTIGYAVNGQPGTIDGWLMDNERILFSVRDGPAKK